MKTVLITGCSTGFGRETASHFHGRGWNVVATMRDTSANTLPISDTLRVLSLDVTDPTSISEAVASAGPIDVLVNNAGIGWLNAVEGTPLDTVRTIFEANLMGVVAMMQAVLPGMRERRSGVIVNVSSSSTYKPLPLLSVYRASKAAVTALTESAALELAEFDIRARVVVPGMAPTTAFADNARRRLAEGGMFPAPYEDFAARTMEMMAGAMAGELTSAEDVAEAIFHAATDASSPMVIPAGADAIAWANAA